MNQYKSILHLFSQPPRPRCLAVRQVEGRKGDQDATAHHEGQRRIPVARHVQEVQHLGLEEGHENMER